jgi:hypothetical protein
MSVLLQAFQLRDHAPNRFPLVFAQIFLLALVQQKKQVDVASALQIQAGWRTTKLCDLL